MSNTTIIDRSNTSIMPAPAPTAIPKIMLDESSSSLLSLGPGEGVEEGVIANTVAGVSAVDNEDDAIATCVCVYMVCIK